MRLTVSSLSTLLIILAACGDAFSPPAGLQFSAASQTCWPGETEIDLAQQSFAPADFPTAPYVELLIPQTPADLRAGHRPASSGTIARYVTGPDQFVIPDSGRVTIRWANKLMVSGSVDIHYPTMRVVGDFHAPWVERRFFCAYNSPRPGSRV